jgi:type I restriction enzyme R subunit
MLTEGVPVIVQKDGQERGERVWLVDFQNPENNVFFAINQFTVTENNQNKRRM